jgi:hypothetical protein
MLAYIHSLYGSRIAVMGIDPKVRRIAAAALFALLMVFVLGLGGLLGGDYLWSHYGPPATDPDEIDALLCGLVVGGIMAVSGGVAIMWKFWPRDASPQSPRAGGKINSA